MSAAADLIGRSSAFSVAVLRREGLLRLSASLPTTELGSCGSRGACGDRFGYRRAAEVWKGNAVRADGAVAVVGFVIALVSVDTRSTLCRSVNPGRLCLVQVRDDACRIACRIKLTLKRKDRHEGGHFQFLR